VGKSTARSGGSELQRRGSFGGFRRRVLDGVQEFTAMTMVKQHP
jgi:hypothetical protein